MGAGQAGLATSFFLTELGREHVVLERGRIANTWHTERWDGFYLNTQKFTERLPGHEYRGPEPDAFSSLAEAIAYLEGYAEKTAAPVRTNAAVRRLRSRADGFLLDVDDDVVEARNVVVATGATSGRRRAC